MDPFFEELRNARVARGFSLEEIEEKTRIGVQFLSALEEGRISVLPEPYVRAFLREYAEAIGMDGTETLKRFAKVTGTAPPPPIPTYGQEVQETAPQSDNRTSSGSLGLRPWTKIAIGSAALLVMLIAVWFLIPKGEPRPTREIPFERTVREAEQRAPSPAPTVTPSRVVPPTAAGDSLILFARTTDSVWLEVTIDSQKPQSRFLIPNREVTWKAREQFTVTTGNAGGIHFKLDTKDLQPIGKAGEVVRNVKISRAGVIFPKPVVTPPKETQTP
jgi:cytoskeleton protein RodZ